LIVAGWPLDGVQLRWQVDHEGVRVPQASADLHGGTIELTATLPRAEGAHSQLEGRFESLPADVLLAKLDDAPLAVAGHVSGRFTAAGLETPSGRTATLEFQGLRASAGRVACEPMSGRAVWQGDELDLTLDGPLLDGQANLRVQGPLQPAAPDWSALKGRLRVRDIRLGKLWPALGTSATLGQLDGVGGAELEVRWAGPQTLPQANGTLSVRDLRLGTELLSPEIIGRLELLKSSAQVRDVTCRLAGGTVEGSLTWRNPHRWLDYTVRGERLSIPRLLPPRLRNARFVTGTLDGELRGRLGEPCSARGQLRMRQGSLRGMTISDLKVPVEGAFSPSSRRTQVRFEVQSGRVASGRASGKCDLTWSKPLSV
jgi:hypothetical protein